MKCLLFLMIPIIFGSCGENFKKQKPLRIALSSATDNYINWLHSVDSTIQVVDLKNMEVDSAVKTLLSCDGLILTGGDDIVPSYYGMAELIAECKVNPQRDSLEFALVPKALKHKMPILGICRGLQLMNVAKGGSLIVDIATYRSTKVVHQCEDYLKCSHKVTIIKETLLSEVCNRDTGMVNTNHHQAIANLGEGLKISARSDDGLAEAIEWADPKGKGFFMAVQWHPERMERNSPMARPLAITFVQACIIHSIIN